eukprot:1139555-Pelagomonas_calceolata.AAC.2
MSTVSIKLHGYNWWVLPRARAEEVGLGFVPVDLKAYSAMCVARHWVGGVILAAAIHVCGGVELHFLAEGDVSAVIPAHITSAIEWHMCSLALLRTSAMPSGKCLVSPPL